MMHFFGVNFPHYQHGLEMSRRWLGPHTLVLCNPGGLSHESTGDCCWLMKPYFGVNFPHYQHGLEMSRRWLGPHTLVLCNPGGMSHESTGDCCWLMKHYFGVQFFHFPPFCLVHFFRFTRFLQESAGHKPWGGQLGPGSAPPTAVAG